MLSTTVVCWFVAVGLIEGFWPPEPDTCAIRREKHVSIGVGLRMVVWLGQGCERDSDRTSVAMMSYWGTSLESRDGPNNAMKTCLCVCGD